MADLPKRGIVRENHFEKDLRAIFGSAALGDEFVAGAEMLLALEAEVGIQSAPDSLVWILPMALHEGRQIDLYYTFNASTVFLIALSAE